MGDTDQASKATQAGHREIIAAFDLDYTLLSGDSDVRWGHYLGHSGLVDKAEFKKGTRKFAEDYARGELDIGAHIKFLMDPVASLEPQALAQMVATYTETYVRPMFRDAMMALVAEHKQQGHTVVIVSATNEMIVRPIARMMHIAHVLATRVALNADGRVTPQLLDVPTYREGKVTRLRAFATSRHADMRDAYYYGDSENDRFVMQAVGTAVAVTPDEGLRRIAQAHNWRIIDDV